MIKLVYVRSRDFPFELNCTAFYFDNTLWGMCVEGPLKRHYRGNFTHKVKMLRSELSLASYD